MRVVFLCLFGLLASLQLSAADCYVSNCRIDKDGTLWCDNEPVDCCSAQSLKCERPINTCVACEEGEDIVQCSTDDGEPVEILVREEPVQVSPEWGRGGLAGEGNDTGLWARSGHYQEYSLEPRRY